MKNKRMIISLHAHEFRESIPNSHIFYQWAHLFCNRIIEPQLSPRHKIQNLFRSILRDTPPIIRDWNVVILKPRQQIWGRMHKIIFFQNFDKTL